MLHNGLYFGINNVRFCKFSKPILVKFDGSSSASFRKFDVYMPAWGNIIDYLF